MITIHRPYDEHGGKQWFALRTRARHERVVRDHLKGQGFEPLLPMTTRVSQWSDRKKLISEPLFPGYCFARCLAPETTALRQVFGVAYVVGREGSAEPVPQEEIDALIRLTGSGVKCDPYVSMSEGTPVGIIRGPLVGVRGRLIRIERRHYVVIGVQLIQQSVTVSMDIDDVVPIDNPEQVGGSALHAQLIRV